MMINRRLIGTVKESRKYIAANVLAQWTGLLANMGMIFSIARLLGLLYEKKAGERELFMTLAAMALCALIRYAASVCSFRMAHLSARLVKLRLRELIYEKLLNLGISYREKAATSEIVQVAVEGVDQLETYFGSYLPQFFYSMLAPLTLFAALAFIDLKAAFVLFICVPLIPAAIAGVQTFAKKLLAKYWGQYTGLGDTFLENLQGLTTLKIYEADGRKQEEMDRQAEQFRKITMKVLTMQLNSITIMDLVAYGGAAAGIAAAVSDLAAGKVSAAGCIAVILLSADFFLPMRLLGSFFHIAMNGMAASDKIFRLLDVPEEQETEKTEAFQPGGLRLEKVGFSYDGERKVLEEVSLHVASPGVTAVAGESGCGKSTAAALILGIYSGFTGSVTVGGTDVRKISEADRMRCITYVGHDSYLFKGTVRDNLLMGSAGASEEKMWEALQAVKLDAFLREEGGLDMVLLERASNLSGGQRQRLALARALLHDSEIYVFDEATSNIDAESEDAIVEQIYRMAETKTVLFISHRLANVERADKIYVMERGRIAESGNHEELLAGEGSTLEKRNVYKRLWTAQQELEHYGKEVHA